MGTQITEPVSWDQGTLEHEPMVAGPAAHLWTPHGPAATPTSTSRCCTTASRSTACRGSRRSASAGSAKAKDFLDGGTRIALDGELPLNPHGGQLSAGRTHGYGFVHEAVTQIRGDAGDRQVQGARSRW